MNGGNLLGTFSADGSDGRAHEVQVWQVVEDVSTIHGSQRTRQPTEKRELCLAEDGSVVWGSTGNTFVTDRGVVLKPRDPSVLRRFGLS